MQLATVRLGHSTSAARRAGDELVLLDYLDVGALLAHDNWYERATADDARRIALDHTQLAPVIPRPNALVCVGLNYRSHIAEMGRDMPAHPTLFAKLPSALIGACDDIELSSASSRWDWEAELAVVVGSPLRNATAKQAQQAIAGFCVANDITARDWQKRTVQWFAGKNFEHTCPLGPFLVTGDEIDNAQDLALSCQVDGDMVQQARTSDLLFDPATVLADLSVIMTLQPGDVVLTGTPSGVGDGRTPPRYLHAGHVVTTTIEGLGQCVNRCEVQRV